MVLALSVVLDAVLIVVLARIAGALFRRAGQPAVVGEILFGVLAVPALLDAVGTELLQELFSDSARSALNTIGQATLVGFVFVVGLELDPSLLPRGRGVRPIALSSAIVPFALGVVLAVTVLSDSPAAESAPGSFGQFALFIGIAMSITAFPVLARILVERRMERTELGALALASAAANDVLGWVLIAVLIGSLEAQAPWEVVANLGLLLLLGALLFGPIRRSILRPLGERLSRPGRPPGWALLATLLTLATFSWAAERVGTDAVIGAFLLGFAWPAREDGRDVRVIRRRLLPVVRWLLPLAFVTPGLEVELSGLGADGLATAALVLLVATAGKVLGVSGMARLCGIRPRPAIALGLLMNTRGLMELIVLNIGLSAGLLDGQLYTAFVLMALATTMLTGPAIGVLYRGRSERAAPVASHDLLPVQSPIPLRE